MPAQTTPLWLEAPATQQLLGNLLDRLESSDVRGTRAQSVALTGKSWPALYQAKFESQKEELWEHLIEMAKWGWLQVKPETALQSTSGYAQAPRVLVANESAIREATGRPERIKSPSERWKEAVEAALDAPFDAKARVAGYCIDIAGRDMVDVVKRLNLLREYAARPLLLREVSSQLFWGMSKVLDNRQALVAAVLGLEECPFLESPVHLQVHLPQEGYTGVLFIENLTSFEQAVRSGSSLVSGLALVYAAGFKGSAGRLRTPAGCSTYFSGRGDLSCDAVNKFEGWLFDLDSTTQVSFWGDLDLAGMQILAAMRSSFPTIQAWKPGYAPMLAALLDGQGHSPESADKHGQRFQSHTGCHYADSELLPAIQHSGLFVDQEQFPL